METVSSDVVLPHVAAAEAFHARIAPLIWSLEKTLSLTSEL